MPLKLKPNQTIIYIIYPIKTFVLVLNLLKKFQALHISAPRVL